ncbi:hypothetical protein M3Y94_01077200 [Aphelenchoides besseyi]|nr:hypothetical protein M3Y94_01077200 [Aphelenchoides besseyi]
MSWRRKVHKTERNEANGVPCQDGRITIALDCSIGLSTNNFQKQINFLINDIFTYQWTNLERLTIIQKNSDCDELPFARKFSSEHTIENVDRYVKHAIQFGNPDLVQLLQQIDEHQTEFSSDIVHLIVFVSQINDTMETTAKPLVQSLMLKNYELTFVALGSNLNSSLFLDLSPNLIEWPIETNLEPKDWSQKFQEAYGCVTQTTTQSTPTSLPPSTSPSTFSTRKPQSEYLPCAGNLYIRLDNSLSLDERVLWTQISFCWTNFVFEPFQSLRTSTDILQ